MVTTSKAAGLERTLYLLTMPTQAFHTEGVKNVSDIEKRRLGRILKENAGDER